MVGEGGGRGRGRFGPTGGRFGPEGPGRGAGWGRGGGRFGPAGGRGGAPQYVSAAQEGTGWGGRTVLQGVPTQSMQQQVGRAANRLVTGGGCDLHQSLPPEVSERGLSSSLRGQAAAAVCMLST